MVDVVSDPFILIWRGEASLAPQLLILCFQLVRMIEIVLLKLTIQKIKIQIKIAYLQKVILVNKVYMIKNILISVLIVSFSSCKAQHSSKTELKNTDYEIIILFLNQLYPQNYHLLKDINTRDLTDEFIGKYRHHQKTFKTSDSICANSSDTLKLKISCPIADSFKKYNEALTGNDLDYLKENYSNMRKFESLDIMRIFENIGMLKIAREDNQSLEINNLYYNERKNVAIIAYSIITAQNLHTTNFYLLQKIDDIWWKPIGPLKL